MSSIVIAIPVMLLLTWLQTTLLSQMPILGATPQIMPTVALAWALVRGPTEGYVWAFVAGLCIDLFSAAPVGVSSLALMCAVLLVTTLQQSIAINRFFIPMLLGGIGMLTFSLTTVLLLRLSGYPIVWSSLTPLLTSAVLHAFLILPFYWVINGVNERFSTKIQASA